MTNRLSSSRTFIFLASLCEAAGHFQTVTNSDLRLQTSDSEHETNKNVAFVLRHCAIQFCYI